MDIHPPEHPIRSVRDFLVQMFTVTCGIIIALGLEALVTWRSDASLASVTRADFRAEISENLANLEQVKPGMQSDFTWMSAMISYGEAKMRHVPGHEPALIGARSFISLPKSAWDTALATQAIHHLRFAEARQLASTYSKQAALNDLEDHAIYQWLTLTGWGDPDALNDADLRVALGELRVAAAYTGSILATEEKVIASYRAALGALGK
jgi:hypothetical protein